MNLKKVLFVAAVVFGLMLLAALIIMKAGQSRAEIPVYDQVQAFSLVERNGSELTEKNLAGKISVVNFFFTNCDGPCPAMNARVAELYRHYSGTPQIQFVSISVDPDRDSLASLKKYAGIFNVTDNRWLFARGEMKEVHRIAEKIFLVGGELPTVHSTKLILVDAQARVRGYYSSEEPASITVLKQHIREIAKELRP